MDVQNICTQLAVNLQIVALIAPGKGKKKIKETKYLGRENWTHKQGNTAYVHHINCVLCSTAELHPLLVLLPPRVINRRHFFFSYPIQTKGKKICTSNWDRSVNLSLNILPLCRRTQEAHVFRSRAQYQPETARHFGTRKAKKFPSVISSGAARLRAA